MGNWGVTMSFNLILLWKLEFFWKMIKRYELCEILGLMWIGLWYLYAYATVFICE